MTYDDDDDGDDDDDDDDNNNNNNNINNNNEVSLMVDLQLWKNIWKFCFKNLLLCVVVTRDINPNTSAIKTKTITVCRRNTKSK